MPEYQSPGVYIEEIASPPTIEGVATAVPAFVGFAPRGPSTPQLVTSWTRYRELFGEYEAGSYLAYAVYGYFNNGGGSAYVVRIGAPETPPPAELPSGSGSPLGNFSITALNAGTDITIEVTKPPKDSPAGTFGMKVSSDDGSLETYDLVSINEEDDKNYVVKVLGKSKLIKVELTSAAPLDAPPTAGTYALAVPDVPVPLPANVGGETFKGDRAGSTGLGGLETIDDVTMVLAPDLWAARNDQTFDLQAVIDVQKQMIAHCEQMQDRVAILDPPPDFNTQDILEWRQNTAGFDSDFATLYWPWIGVADPLSNKTIFVPPSGHIAGVWARSDRIRGVHKAPANEKVNGLMSLQMNVSTADQDQLNTHGVNCIRNFPGGRGTLVWGARTLMTQKGMSKYINVRRLFNYIEESVLDATSWVVFEPNDMELWQKVRREVTAFLLGQWRSGALFGATPEEAFFVKCDGENNPKDSRDRGYLYCDIGIAPVLPAEFVVFRIRQGTADADSA